MDSLDSVGQAQALSATALQTESLDFQASMTSALINGTGLIKISLYGSIF